MRKSALVLALTVAFGTAALAQETSSRQIHLGVDPGFSYSDRQGLQFENVYSLGVTVPLRGRWSLDSTLSWWDYSQSFASGCDVGLPCILEDIDLAPEILVAGTLGAETYGLDLFPLYGIPTSTRWTPYVGAGARMEYVDYQSSFTAVRDSWLGWSPGVALGITVPIGQRFAFQTDGRYYPDYATSGESQDSSVRDVEQRRSDTLIRVGLGWRY